ncbi:MAG: FtsX-like permease family protein [Prevotella sp.]|nr:FtsX-like permease family protein [Prevotella sp.]
MNIPFFVAGRYILSKKSTNAINLISAISVVGVTVASAALIVVLSVFNGFRDMVASFQTNFDPQLKITAAAGKTMAADAPELQEVRRLDAIDVATECMEDVAVAVYNGRQLMLTLKGVDDNFDRLTHITDCLYGDGEFCLHAGAVEYAVVGARAAQELGCDVRWTGYMRVYAARREGQLDMSDAESGFVVDSLLLPTYVFSVGQTRYDKSVILAPIAFARRLFHTQGEMTSLEIRLKNGADIGTIKKEIKRILGERYVVRDRFEQQADTFRIMQIEKIIAYIFLVFILVVACFNIIGSISMLIIDKKDDARTLHNLGMADGAISRIFLFEGWIITFFGAVIGVVLGLVLCWLQQQYGLVSMGERGVYVTDAYPVSVHYGDVAVVLVTVIVVGWLAVWYPVRYMASRLLED